MEITYDPLLNKVRKEDSGTTPGPSGDIPLVPNAIDGDSVILNSDGSLRTLDASHQFIQPNCGWVDSELGTPEIINNDTLKWKAPFTFYNSKGRKVQILDDVSLSIADDGAYLFYLIDSGIMHKIKLDEANVNAIYDKALLAIVNKNHSTEEAGLIKFQPRKDAPYTEVVKALGTEKFLYQKGFALHDVESNTHGTLDLGYIFISSVVYSGGSLSTLYHTYTENGFINYTSTLDNKLTYDGGKYNPRGGSLTDIPVDKYTWVNFIYIPYSSTGKPSVGKMMGRTLYNTVNEAKADLYSELIRLQDDLNSGIKPMFLHAVLIDKDGTVYDVEAIKRSYINSAQPEVLGTATGSFFRDVIYGMTAGTVYTLPTDYEAGDKIRYVFNGMPPAIIRPDNSQRFKYEGSEFTIPYGVGFMYASMSQWGEFSCEYNGDDTWRIISWSGRFIFEGARAWFPFDEACYVQPSQNVWATVLKEKLFNQNMQGNNVVYTIEDSPYPKSNATYSEVTFGKFDSNCLNVDQYGEAIINDVRNLNPFRHITKDYNMEMWVKRTVTGQGYERTIFECGEANNHNSYRLFFNTSDCPALAVFTDAGTLLLLESADPIMDDGNWHRISFLKRGDRVALYVDREKKDIDTLLGTMTFDGKFALFNDLNGEYPHIGRVKDLFFVEGSLYEMDIESPDQLPHWGRTPNWLELNTEV